MSRWLCVIARQHRWSFPQPTQADVARWIAGNGPIGGLVRHCTRCGLTQQHTASGMWRDLSRP